MTSLKKWLSAVRPKTLPAAVAPVITGAAMALKQGHFDGPAFAACLAGALLLQIGANFTNDYYDYVKGADNEDRLGPTRSVQAGLISPDNMKRAFILCFAAVFIPGAYLVYIGGWPILVLGCLSILAGWAYTGGPFALAYNGLGDLFVLLFFGFVAVGGTWWVMAHTLPGFLIAAGLIPGLLATNILVVNNLRDMQTDREAGKKTLAVRFGVAFTRLEYLANLAMAMGASVYLLHLFELPVVYMAVCPAVLLLLSLPPLKLVLRLQASAALNPALGTTARALVLYCLVFSLIIIMG